jgi:hypothetical protein
MVFPSINPGEIHLGENSKQTDRLFPPPPGADPALPGHLYRVIYHHREELERLWEERFEDKYGKLRTVVLEAFDSYLNCGILIHGCARAYCENCKHSELIAFSCKRRGLCPSCDAKRGIIFAENLHENIIGPHPVRHLVFSIPKRLRLFFKYDRKLTKLL